MEGAFYKTAHTVRTTSPENRVSTYRGVDAARSSHHRVNTRHVGYFGKMTLPRNYFHTGKPLAGLSSLGGSMENDFALPTR